MESRHVDRVLGRRAGDTLADAVFIALKRGIVENRLEPDTILTELEVAARYAVSRAPAREALKRLSSTGLARARQRIGYVVTSVSLADFDEVFALRLAIEPLAAELAVHRLTPADVELLERLAGEARRVVDAPLVEQRARMSQLNADFHRAIARMSGNGRLERVIAGLIDELERVMHMLAYSSTVGSVLEQHATLVRVMKSGDAAAAGQLMREQLAHDYDVMRSLVVRPPAWRTAVGG